MEKTMEKIVALAKARGFVYPGSEIYGGLANTWDYGNLGVELKNNVKKAWWQKFITENPYNVGVDCAILMNPQTWVASGHLGGFSDPLMDCKECKERFRADKIIEDYAQENHIDLGRPIDAYSQEEMKNFIEEHNVPCPTCGKHNFTDIRQFNLMFKTFQGVTEDARNTVYLRPETAQGIFVNFKNVQRTSRKKIPFGIGQIGLVGGSGLINGLVDCDAPHIIKGRIVKEKRTRQEESQKRAWGSVTTIYETDVNKMVFNILTPEGFRSLS